MASGFPKLDSKFSAAVRAEGGPYTKYGAGLLVDRINAYWAERGFKAVRAERYAIRGEGVWGVRSNLVNGLPRKPGRAPGTKMPVKSIQQRRAEAMHGV